jgi:5-methylcytosine-specific restriction endonuclease McrA
MAYARRVKSAPASGGRFPPLLAVDCAGRPIHWVGWQEAVRHYVLEQVVWTAGNPAAVVHGGISVAGVHSQVSLHPVIALRGADGGVFEEYAPPLSNPALFARDRYRCLYCGEDLEQRKSLATRDHVYPRSRGGTNTWGNLVTACRACSARKDDRTPEEAGMRLLAVPYTPNYAEHLILGNRRILADQMEFLSKHLPRSRRLMTP